MAEDDYRALPHPDAVKRWAEEGTLYEWVVCAVCGKEYQRKVLLEELRDSMVKWCSICEMKFQEERDMCPEGVTGKGFASACSLPFRHEGRCEPFKISEEVIRELREQREQQNS